MNANSEARLGEVHPILADRVRKQNAALEAEGYSFEVYRGIATVAQQDALWQKGRDENGTVVDRHAVVTHAKGTQSNHVLGFAVDRYLRNEDGSPNWDAQHEGYQRMIATAPTYGLRSGASWGDPDHVELVEVPTTPAAETQQTYLDAGVQTVWEGVS